MLKCSSSQLMASGRYGMGMGKARRREFDHAPLFGQHNWTWCIFLWWGHKSGKVDLGEIGSKCDRGALYKIYK